MPAFAASARRLEEEGREGADAGFKRQQQQLRKALEKEEEEEED